MSNPFFPSFVFWKLTHTVSQPSCIDIIPPYPASAEYVNDVIEFASKQP